MSSMSALQRRIDDTVERADAIINRRVGEEEAALKREDAAREDARRAKMREAAEQRREIQAVYADSFAAFGTEVPPPIDDESVGRYRARLFNRLVRKLPQNHEWSSTRADDIPAGPAMDNIEALVIAAAKAEGQKPSFENLPSDGMVMRTRVDDMGEKSINWFGRESFIKSMGREGRRVLHIKNPQTGAVLWGQPIETAPTFRR